MRKIATIIISIGIILSYMVIGNQVDAEGDSSSIGKAVPTQTPSPEIPATTPTVYKDWSEITKLDKDYSHSTLFYREDTKIQILKNGGSATWKTTNGITFPEITLHTGQDAIILITNCAIDKDGRNQDVVIKINNVHEWSSVDNNKVFITFWRQEFLNSQTRIPAEHGYDYVRDIAVGELINFDLEAYFAECDFNMTYYNSGTYSYNASNGTESGTLGNITSVNNFVYDIDVAKNTNRFFRKTLQGNEGLIPFTGDPTIYYKKFATTADSYNAGLQELQGGICVKDSASVNVDAIWYKSSAFITANNLKNSTYSFRYGGEGCGIVYSFTSPYPYETESPSKTVSKTKVKEQENFNYTITQYIPNNYYGSLINFNEIYSNLYGNTHFINVEISDTLNENLVINGNITITDGNGKDRSNFFDVIVSGNSVRAVAKSSALNQVDFYAHIYNINIPVYIKNGTGPKLTSSSTIDNKAHFNATMEDENINLDTNTVSTALYYNITTSMENGNITPSASVDIHTNKTITLTPNQGYYVYSITIDGVEQDVSNYYNGGTINLPDITKDYNIAVRTKAYGQAQITKRNTLTSETLEGAIIGLYYDTTCQTPVEGKGSLVTGASGSVLASNLREGTYYAKEIQAPNNYTLNSTIQKITIYSGQTTPILVENMPNMAKIEVDKLDNNTGKIITKEDTSFALYEWSQTSKTWVKPTHIDAGTVNGTAPDGIGTILTKKNAETKGSYTATMYYNAQNQGKYKVVEAVRPFGYTNSNWETEIQITADGQVFRYTSEARNVQVRGQINFKKNDSQVNYKNISYGENYAQADATLKGATYRLYAKEDILSPDDGSVLYKAKELIASQTTDQEGKITWENLYLGKYYIQEQTPSTGYIKDETEYEVDLQTYYHNIYFTQGNQTAQNIIYQNTTQNSQYENPEQRVIGKEDIIKQSFQLTKLEIAEDSNMGNPLQGAGFKIFLISELSKVKDGSIKPDTNGNYKASDFLFYDFSKEQTAITFNENSDGERIPELFSNEDGILISPELAYGKYVVIESTTPENVKTVEPFLINIQEDSRTPKKMIYPLDREFEARIEIIKKDKTTGKRVLKENAAYRIWDKINNQYVEQWVTYPKKIKYGTEENPYKTSEEGYLLTPEVLGIGDYELREVGAPEGYVIAGKEEIPQSNVTFSISTNSVYEIDPDLGKNNAIIIVEQSNTPQLGTITVTKQGEYLNNGQENEGIYQFEYSKRPVTDARFALYAKEDIYTQDNQNNKLYEKGQFIKEVAVDQEGKAKFENLPLGNYYVKETKAGNGFTLNQEEKEVTLSYGGQDQTVVYNEVEYTNERQKIEINITKKDKETRANLQGAEFGLYVKEAINYIDNLGNSHTVPENQLVGKGTTNENGTVTFNQETLPLGKYYLKELVAPQGYAINSQVIDIDCSYIGEDTEKIEKNIEITNQITKLEIQVMDYETDVNLINTQIVLKDEQGNEVGTYTIDNLGKIELKGLLVGKKYYIEEQQARDGYIKELLLKNEVNSNELAKEKEANGSISFTIQNSEEIQKVTLRNLSKVGKISIEKTGETLVGIEKDNNGNIKFNYETNLIDTATFEIYAKEDIIHPDGTQGILATKGMKIAEGQTQNGILTVTKFSNEIISSKPQVVQTLLNRGLPLGEYEIKETKAPQGYYYEEHTKTVKVEQKDDTANIENYEISINNQRQTTNIGRLNPGISIEKKAERKVYKVGEQVVYTITVTNTGDTILKNIEVEESMLNGEFDEIEEAEKQNRNKMIIHKLEIGEQKQLTYRYNLSKGNKGKVVNEVTATGTPVIVVTNEENEEIEETLEPITDDGVEEIWNDELIEKTVNKQTAKAGDIIEYTLIITNPYDEPIENAIVEDQKVTEGSIISTSKEGITAKKGRIIVGSMQAREKIEIVYKYQIPEDYDSNTLVNTAKLKGNKGLMPIVSKEVSTTVEIKKSEIQITKQTEKESYQKGEEVNYIIKVTNTGTTKLKDITIKENLLNGKFQEQEGISIENNQTVKIDKLEVGQSITLTYQYTVENEKLLGEKVKNKVIATGIGIIENPNNPDNPNEEPVKNEAEKEIIITNNEIEQEGKLGVYKTDEETGEAIKGVIFGLYAKEDILGKDNNVLIEKDSLIERATTNQEGYATFKADLPIAKYYIVELKPAKGYIENTKKIEIDATDIEASMKEYPVRLEMKNKKTEVNIEKIELLERIEDLSLREQIVGTKMQILEEILNEEENDQGVKQKIIEEWITEEEAHNIKGLETQKEYTLREVEPSKGYVTAQDIKFSINLDGSLTINQENTIEGTDIPTVVMQDDVTKIKIEVIDKETKEPIKGIVVQIVDKETKEVVYEFTTEEEEQIIEKIPIGDYEIIEKEFPKEDGYVSIETEEFTIEDTPEEQEKIIEQDYTKLDISFIDEITKELLLGGKLEIRNEEGEVVATIEKTDEHTYIERLPVGEYIIVETEVPEGYEPIEEIKFTLEDVAKIQYVVIENKRLPFDMQVEKYASEVLVNGKKQMGANKVGQLVKIEVDGKKIAKQNVQITYTIKVTNTGKVTGCVGKIIDKVPLGLTFDPSKNEKYWNANGNTIVSTEYAETKIKPEESIELKIVLDWVRSDFNLGEKENIVTIGEFSNGPGFEDEEKENNESRSSILLSVKTGLELVLTNQITALILLELCGIALIAILEIVFLNKRTKKSK